MFDIDPTWQIEKGSTETRIDVKIGPVDAQARFPSILNKKIAGYLRSLSEVTRAVSDGYEGAADEVDDMAEVLDP